MTAIRPGRNDRCPCGSGLKYKHCHLKRIGTALSSPETPDGLISEALDALSSPDAEILNEGVKALERLRSRPDLTPSDRSTVLTNLAKGLQRQGRHKEALALLEPVSRERDDHLRPWILHLVAVSLAEIGQIEEARRQFEDALALPPMPDPRLRASIAFEAGNLYKRIRQYDRVIELWRDALKDYELARDVESANVTRSSLAALALRDPSPEMQAAAVKAIEQASDQNLAAGDLTGFAVNCFRLSSYYREKRQFQSALAYGRKDLSVSRLVGNEREVAKSLDNLARIYADLLQPTAARAAILEAKAIGERLDNPAVISNANNALLAIDHLMRDAHIAGKVLGPKAPCACDSGRSYRDCCGRADFDPLASVRSESFGILRNLTPVAQGPGASAARLDYFLREAEDVKDRRSWQRIDSHDGWREVSELADAANIHLSAARALASEGHQEPDGLSKPVGTLILSACALEAFANQVAFFFAQAKAAGASDLPELTAEVEGDIAEFQRRTSLVDKWSILASSMCSAAWPPPGALWDEFLRLVEFRNELVHFKSAEYEQIVPPPTQAHRMVQRLPPSVSPRPIVAGWPSRVLTPELGDWAVGVADRMIRHFRSAYRQTRSHSSTTAR
jgi:tetratricopeptide (TPR) repeat protein